MTPKEKAKDLVSKFENVSIDVDFEDAKDSALICVDEIISACECNNVESWNADWWNKVKQEIKLL